MNPRPEKILALQFKYFGDAVLMTPALRAIREQLPGSELHLLVPEEIAPLFTQLPWLNRVWPMPRKRGRASFGKIWPMICALRRERFDRSVDFAGNDRGAILSFFIGAKNRLGWNKRGGFFGRKFCYNHRVTEKKELQHESIRLAQLLFGWQMPPPRSFEIEIRADPSLAAEAKTFLPEENAVVCHIASSQPKKEWPLQHWAKLHQLAAAEGFHLFFTTARGEREQLLTDQFKKLAPDAAILPAIADLPLFLAMLKRAKIFISGDTGPLHFAAGLGAPTISLFGPTSPARWAPIGDRHQFLTGASCDCSVHSAICHNASHCLAAISPEQVFDRLKNSFNRNDRAN